MQHQFCASQIPLRRAFPSLLMQIVNKEYEGKEEMSTPQPSPYTALYLYPLNDRFKPKRIALNNGQRVKIGRKTGATTLPEEGNGYFDSLVLSRQHAEVWARGGKIYIQDTKSYNGTFINGERLSSQEVESDVFELKSDDILEIGVDVADHADSDTILHHKVTARVVCIFTEQDAQVAAQAETQPAK
ncbi:SMAD/FHA domain-containing protein [Coprinopsis sp. MPI-PUGE-AT-0042]|nr:SMAD/FHA domain-containing protein [Coprinopsis sp. MPI-PUGE-AT-0042]